MSPQFEHGGVIPERFSQNGENLSPPLEFIDVPEGTQSLVLIMDDPDAPRGRFTHWVAFNIDPHVHGFGENAAPDDVHYGLNDKGESGYVGPKPPDREHRYFFKLSALDTRFDLRDGASREEVEAAMRRRVLARAELMGRYAPPGRGENAESPFADSAAAP